MTPDEAKKLRAELGGKTILIVPRSDSARFSFFTATTLCKACRALCTIAPASIARLRAVPTTVVLCCECGLAVHDVEPFSKIEMVSLPELREAIETMRRAK